MAGLPVENAEDVANILIDLATQVGADDLSAAARQVREAVNPDGALASCEKDFSRRRIYLSPLLDGMYTLDGILDPEAAAVVSTALQPFLVPSDASDERDTAQRRADGLVALAGVAMDQSLLPISGGSKPTLNVLTTLETLQGMKRSSSTPPDAPRGTGALIDSTGGVLGSVAAQRLACDATISRVLLDPEGIPVQLGRAQRLFSPHQRKLLALRDAGCRFPGCGLPPAFTDAHHLHPWQAGGATDLPNGLLVCRWHHRHLHERGWQVRPDDPVAGANHGLTFTGPRGQKLRSSPRSFTHDQLAKLTLVERATGLLVRPVQTTPSRETAPFSACAQSERSRLGTGDERRRYRGEAFTSTGEPSPSVDVAAR